MNPQARVVTCPPMSALYAKTACDVQIAAALATGVPAEKLSAAAGEQASALTEFYEDREPPPAEG